ncbi:voltage-dependent T-type calcium channel subunit alpha-1H isoform X1 [Leptopilina heterotoma]|uniref:voltage-dependent T-type calcium channel subunit alpha-1H isoform X1 n=2 Tax=Leptopilina heterotoma TaxID=63436 RepID=UPI001CA804A6|nr:voltage-dependent T-type calcium channel subunit alpha-1H isoform X1 [Leptopilina heterotoma]
MSTNCNYNNYRYCSATRMHINGISREQISDSDMAELSELDDDEGNEDDIDEEHDDDEDEEGNSLPYPGFAPIALRYLRQNTKPRNWCLALITNPWFERVSIMIILLNCLTLGMYQPCVDDQCETNRCKILQMFDDIIFAFFALEMTIKMVAMGLYGKGSYLADSWNRLDFFIVAAGILEYCLNVENMNLSAIRTIRVLRPLRAINRIPSMRILVMLLLDTLPMLGNVLLLCFFVFFIFGIVGVQLWEGILRQRCFLKAIPTVRYPDWLRKYFEYQGQDYICSKPEDNGMHSCHDLPSLKFDNIECNHTALVNSNITFINDNNCVNWNYYYTECKGQGNNPFQGTISFDNIGLAWVAIFLVISLEGWTDIMYYVQDAHSFWDWIYFVLLIVIGSFFMINLCLVVIATQFSETKKREMERMRLERARFQSTSTLASSTNVSEPTTCYAEIVKYIAHLWRRGKRRLMKRYRLYLYSKQQKQDEILLKDKLEQCQATESGIKKLHSSNIFCGATSKLITVLGSKEQNGKPFIAPHASPEISEIEHSAIMYQRTGIYRLHSISNCSESVNSTTQINNSLLSPPSANFRRRSSVMFSDVILLHGGSVHTLPGSVALADSNVCCNEKMTQTSDGHVWLIPLSKNLQTVIKRREAMSCQELLALSGAFSAALPTGQLALDSFLNTFKNGIKKSQIVNDSQWFNEVNNCSCCYASREQQWPNRNLKCQILPAGHILKVVANGCIYILCYLRQWVKRFVDSKIFQQGILLAILINTLSMGIEYHNQPEELTVLVEISNIAFSAVFAAEMLLKIIAEGPFGYISNGFNVFDGIVVILSVVELCQAFVEERGGSSGLSVLRTFRLLRILKLVRFMPNLRRQLFVMLRTMDNVAVFFSLLVLFIFIFSILGMYLFGGKFCMWIDRTRPCTCAEVVARHPMCQCDRKHFNDIVWALVTVFQILTQEDWNVVLFNGMQKTSHWAALYFVALMTFGNYVLFNLLVAILVEGFSSERNERREREQRELARLAAQECTFGSDEGLSRISAFHSFTDSDTYTQDSKQDFRKMRENCEQDNYINVRKQLSSVKYNKNGSSILTSRPSPPIITHTAPTPQDSPNTTFDTSYKDLISRDIYNKRLSFSSIDKYIKQGINQTNDVESKACNTTDWTLKHNLISNVMKSSKKDTDSTKIYPTSIPSTKGCVADSVGNDTFIYVPNNRAVKLISKNESPSLHINENSSHCSSNSQCFAFTKQCHWAIKDTQKSYETMKVKRTFTHQDHGTACIPNDVPVNASSPKKNSPSTIKNHRNSQTEDLFFATSPKNISNMKKLRKMFISLNSRNCLKGRDELSLYIFSNEHKIRILCKWFVDQKWFDNVVLLFIGLNCITLAMERPNIPPDSFERIFLSSANYIFTAVFAMEMLIKVIATGMLYGPSAYFTSGWNIMDGSLVIISITDLLMSLISANSPKIFGILRVFRLLRSLRPLRVINRAPGLKLVVQTLLSSLRPIGNIVLICCTFFVIFGILGVQLFKGAFFYCEGPDVNNIRNKTDCLSDKRNIWLNRKYNFDDLGKALMSLFVLSSRDGWVNIMYTGLDAVGVDQQPIENYSEWRLLYFISFILLVGFFVLNMFVGVVVENFHRCREEQEKEERVRRAAKRALQMEKKRRRLHEPPYYNNYSKVRLFIHNVVTSKYFDLAIAAVIGLNVVTMALEFYMMPKALTYALKIFNYFFTAVFILESIMKLIALGIQLYLKDKWNQLDVGIVILSVVGIVLEEVESKVIPINPTIIRVMRVLRIARVLKLLKMAKGIRALLDTVMQALPQVGNLGLLFFLLFFIFAALGVELFGRLECSDEMPCQGLGEHAHFSNFGMAFLTLFRVATGDNWNGIMKDTLRDNCDDSEDCVKNCCVSNIIAPIFFVIFVLMAQFVLVNVVVAVLMKHLEESHKQMEDELDMESQLERELLAEQEELLVGENENVEETSVQNVIDDNEIMTSQWKNNSPPESSHGLSKVRSLPSNFIYNHGSTKNQVLDASLHVSTRRRRRRRKSTILQLSSKSAKLKSGHKYSNMQQQSTINSPKFECNKVVSNSSNYLIPPTISYSARSRDTSADYLKSEKEIKLKTPPIDENFCISSKKIVHGNNVNNKPNNFHEDYDVQSIINERRPLKLKVNVSGLSNSNRNDNIPVAESRCNNISNDDNLKNYSVSFSNDFSSSGLY